jgi:8-oxo-dGTP pyrophosphatase MutT (NUDIX family)
MADVEARLEAEERELRFPNIRPRDAATLIVVDRSTAEPKVLMGRRHDGHTFMPGKFVFPGGRVETYDGRMPAAGSVSPHLQDRLLHQARRQSALRARALLLAAIRETCEETGLLIGQPGTEVPMVPAVEWEAFAHAKVLPDINMLHYIARAITPPQRPRRFDTRFFTADAQCIAERIEGLIGPESELTELVWVSLAEARNLDLPAITHIVLDELETRIRDGFGRDLPVPFYRQQHGRFVRHLL